MDLLVDMNIFTAANLIIIPIFKLDLPSSKSKYKISIILLTLFLPGAELRVS